MQLINNSGITHLYIAFDPDKAGLLGTIKVLLNIDESIIVDIMLLPEGKDVNDLTQEEFNNLKIIDKSEFIIKNKKLYEKLFDKYKRKEYN